MVRGFRRDPVGAGSEASQAKVSVLIAEGLTSASLAMDTPEIPGGDRRPQRFSILVHHLARNDSFRGEEDLMDETLSLRKPQRLALVGGEAGGVASQNIFSLRKSSQAVFAVRVAGG